jgi:hypothetical protein
VCRSIAKIAGAATDAGALQSTSRLLMQTLVFPAFPAYKKPKKRRHLLYNAAEFVECPDEFAECPDELICFLRFGIRIN